MALAPIGVIHGRFQPLHLGHLEYLLAGKSKCQRLIIGITNPDPSLTREHVAAPARSQAYSNPFTYYERLQMVRDALLEASVERHEFEIVPFPINYPALVRYYVPMDALFFLTIYDEWGQAKLAMLRSLHVAIEVLWERSLAEKMTSGTEIRQLMKDGNPWQHLVPPAVARIILDREPDIKLRLSQGFS